MVSPWAVGPAGRKKTGGITAEGAGIGMVLYVEKMCQIGTAKTIVCFTLGNLVPKAQESVAKTVESRYNFDETNDSREYPLYRKY